MDGLMVLRRWTQGKWGFGIFALICMFPVVAGSIARTRLGKWVFMDVDAVLCAADRMRAGQSPYHVVKHAVCNGGDPAAFVYAPQIAALFMPAVEMFGVAGARGLYLGLVLLPALLFLFWYALIKPFGGLDVRYRLLGIGGLTAITLWCANLGLIMHAAVLASLVLVPRNHTWGRIPFIVVVCLCACVKPIFLTYFVVFLLEEQPCRQRLKLFLASSLVGIATVATIVLTAGEHGEAWMTAIRAVALSEQPGLGWSSWTSAIGIPTDSTANTLLALGFMAIVAVSGLIIAHWGGLSNDERTLLGVGLAPLMTPRLCDYDMILLVPFAALVMSVAHRQGGRIFRYNLSWLFCGVLLIGVAANLFEIKPYYRPHYATLLTTFITLAVGWMLLVRNWKDVMSAINWLSSFGRQKAEWQLSRQRRLLRPTAEINDL